jgi:hypothetical protein
VGVQVLVEIMVLVATTATIPAAVPPEDPIAIARESARDLKDAHFYNRPGATRKDYDAAWQECRLIARGSVTPTGTAVVLYNPAVISPVAAGAAGGIGAAIGAAIAEGILRRANRASCLMVRGWRQVEVDAAERKRVAAMSEAQQNAYFAEVVGAVTPPAARINVWQNDFAAPKLAPVGEQ